MNRICKFLYATLMIIMILCMSVFSSFAENAAYEIDDINMSIAVPDNMLVATRNSKQDDAFFTAFELNYAETMNVFENNNIYFEAMEKDSSITLTISMTSTTNSIEIDSYNSLEQTELDNIKNNLLQSKAYKSCSSKEYNGVTYLVLTENTKVNGKVVRAQIYNTVMNGNNYLISFKAEPGKKLTVDDKALFDAIMQTVSIKDGTFLSSNGEVVLAVVLTLVILAVIIILLVVLYKYLTNPARKNKKVIHELAHEHQISDTTFVPRKKLYHLMDNSIVDETDFMEEYEPLQEIGAEPVSKVENLSQPSEAEQALQQDTKKIADEAVVINKEKDFDGGTDYFSAVPEEKDMYSYSNVDVAVDDYNLAKKQQARQRRRLQQEQKPQHPKWVQVLKVIGLGIVKVFQTIFVAVWYVAVHCKYFAINFYRLLKKKKIQRKRRKIEAQRKERARQRKIQQQEAEERRRIHNENCGENELIKVRTRGEVRTQSRGSYNKPTSYPGRTTHSSKRY